MKANTFVISNAKQKTDTRGNFISLQPCSGETTRSFWRGGALICAQRDTCINYMHYVFGCYGLGLNEQLNQTFIQHSVREYEQCEFKSGSTVGVYGHINTHDD